MSREAKERILAEADELTAHTSGDPGIVKLSPASCSSLGFGRKDIVYAGGQGTADASAGRAWTGMDQR